MKDYLTEAVTGTRTTWKCARCGAPCPSPDALAKSAKAHCGRRPLCGGCFESLNALTSEEIPLTAAETMASMPPASGSVH